MIRELLTVFMSIALVISSSAAMPELQGEPMEELVYEEDLYWLSRLIYAEAGSDECSDELQLAVGSVVLNRIKSELYPYSVKEVIFDAKHGVQYGCTQNGMIYQQPNDRAIENAEWLLRHGSTLPDNVLGQSDKVVLRGKYKAIQGVVFSYY